MIESYGKSRISTVAEVDDMSSHSNFQSTVNTFKKSNARQVIFQLTQGSAAFSPGFSLPAPRV